MTALPTELPTLPAWNTPVITPSLIVAEGLVPISIYGDEVWSLAPLIANPSGVRVGIDWSRFPDPFREEIQPAAWTMINTVLLHERASRPPGLALASGSARSLRHRPQVAALRPLGQRPRCCGAGACTAETFTAYAAHAARRLRAGRGDVTKELVALTRLWAFDTASARPAGLVMPPWQRYGVDDYLPATPAEGGGENSREPIPRPPWARC